MSWPVLSGRSIAFGRGHALDPRAKRSVLDDSRSEPVWAQDSTLASDADEPAEAAPDRALAYSAIAQLRQRDFGLLTADEADAIQAAMFAIACRLPYAAQPQAAA